MELWAPVGHRWGERTARAATGSSKTLSININMITIKSYIHQLLSLIINQIKYKSSTLSLTNIYNINFYDAASTTGSSRTWSSSSSTTLGINLNIKIFKIDLAIVGQS